MTLAIEGIVGRERSPVLCSEKLQRFQNTVKVELLEPERDDSRSLIFPPPASHLLGLVNRKIIEEFPYGAGRRGDGSKLLCISLPFNIPTKRLVRNLVHAPPPLRRQAAEFVVNVRVDPKRSGNSRIVATHRRFQIGRELSHQNH